MDVLVDSVLDVLKTIPVLIIVYTLLYWMESRTRTTPALLEKAAQFGPVCGAVAGAVPQCGFSAAVFLATSDEAIPVLLGNGCGAAEVVRLAAVKTVLAVAGGYLLRLTVLRARPKWDEPLEVELDGCSCCSGGGVFAVLWRTSKTVLLLFIVLFLFNTAVSFIGETRISVLLLSGSVFQPLLCATVGLIPSCAVSVLLAELYAGGAIGFGSMIAGLSTGAGFGYMILLSDRSQRKNAVQVIALTWLLSAAGGIAAQAIFG